MVNRIARFFSILLALFLLQGGVWFFAIHAQAATVTDIIDQPTSLRTSTAANHKITVTVVSEVSEGDTLTISFPSAFDTASITEDDIDVADDGVERTTAVDCAGGEHLSVGMAADVLTITVCAGDGGVVDAGSVVEIEIGTNASASGTGSNRIVNPSTAGTYMLSLGGTFGDNGSVPLPISSAAAASGVSGVIVAPSSSPPDFGRESPDPGPDPVPDDPDDVTDPDPDGDPDPEPDPEPDPVDDTGPDPAPDNGDSDPADDSSANDGDAVIGDDVSNPDSDEGSGAGNIDADDGAADEDSGPRAITVTTGMVSPDGVMLSPIGDLFTVLHGTMPVVQVEVSDVVELVRVLLNGDAYVIEVRDGAYRGSITTPQTNGFLVVEVTQTNGEVIRETYALNVVGGGMVYELRDGARVPVSGAIVTVYQVLNGARVAYEGIDPLVVGEDGAIAWYVPNGTYIVTAAKTGYSDGTSGIVMVRNGILAPSIVLERNAETPVTVPNNPSENEITEPGVAPGVLTTVVQTLGDLREIPQIQVATAVASPAAAVLAGASIVMLASSFQLWPFLQYLITSPILFFARRKRTTYGIVYNAATKLPIDLAIVRAFALPERKLVRTVVTDAKGKYVLTVAPGRYALEVTKPNFTFPSAILAGKKDDGTYLDVYSGQEVVVTADDAVIAANVPLDPAVPIADSARVAVSRRFLRVLQHTIAIIGVCLAIGVFVVTPTLLTGLLCVVQVFVYVLVRRLAHPRRPKGWGIVYDAHTRQPVGNTVVRLFEPTYNKLIETVVTDRFGRYTFLVGPSEYYVTYAKPGYVEKIVRPLDFRTVAEPSTISLDVPIDAAKA